VLKRQTSGSVICTSCGVLVGVGDETCYNCGRRNPGLWGYAPALRSLGQDLGFVPLVIGTCVIVFGLMLVFSGGVGGSGIFSFGSPSGEALFVFGASGARPVFLGGRWWTVLSAGWLHGGLLHIFMNMMAVRVLAPAVADLFGPGRMVIIYVLSSVAGFLLSTLAIFLPNLIILRAGGTTVGASAAIAGLIGAILAYGHRSGSSQARAYAMQYVVMLLIMGVLLSSIIDNYAHLGGFAGGYFLAKFLDPLKPERVDHMVIALICLVLSIGSVAFSFYHGLQFLQ
jgi:rhomboid protease GluP